MEIQVKGHSGCQIDIVNDSNNLFIYKSTHDPKYIKRLYLQAKKQQEACNKTYQHIRIPEIFDIDKSEEYLIIKMEYVYSKNYVDYFEDAGFDNINYFIKALKIFVNEEIEDSPLQKVNTKIVKDKFEDVYRKCSANEHIAHDDEIKDILESCKKIFSGLSPEIEIPVGKCHGDLTFSNILFNGNNYYLIDFLDSFIESPLLDLVKIRQDSKYEWSRLMYEDDVDMVRLSIISSKIDNEINRYYQKYEWYQKYYHIFQLMNFLRILQYAKEDSVIKFLKNVLKSLL